MKDFFSGGFICVSVLIKLVSDVIMCFQWVTKMFWTPGTKPVSTKLPTDRPTFILQPQEKKRLDGACVTTPGNLNTTKCIINKYLCLFEKSRISHPKLKIRDVIFLLLQANIGLYLKFFNLSVCIGRQEKRCYFVSKSLCGHFPCFGQCLHESACFLFCFLLNLKNIHWF